MSGGDLLGVLEAAREASANTTDQGNRFERLCRAALTAHDGANGRQRFTRVWSWDDWPGRRDTDGVDIGIDLVAEQTPEFGGGLCAIQCKFYTGQVSTDHVNSFIAAAARDEFTHRIIMHTGTGIQSHGRTKMEHSGCEEVDLGELAGWDVDWWELAEEHHVVAPGTPRKTLGQRFGRRRTATTATLPRRCWRRLRAGCDGWAKRNESLWRRNRLVGAPFAVISTALMLAWVALVAALSVVYWVMRLVVWMIVLVVALSRRNAKPT